MADNDLTPCDLSFLTEARLDPSDIRDVRKLRSGPLRQMTLRKEFAHKGILIWELETLKGQGLANTQTATVRVLVVGELVGSPGHLLTYWKEGSAGRSRLCAGTGLFSNRPSFSPDTAIRWCNGLQFKWSSNTSSTDLCWDKSVVWRARAAHVRDLMQDVNNGQEWDDIDWNWMKQFIDRASDQLDVSKAPTLPPRQETLQETLEDDSSSCDTEINMDGQEHLAYLQSDARLLLDASEYLTGHDSQLAANEASHGSVPYHSPFSPTLLPSTIGHSQTLRTKSSGTGILTNRPTSKKAAFNSSHNRSDHFKNATDNVDCQTPHHTPEDATAKITSDSKSASTLRNEAHIVALFKRGATDMSVKKLKKMKAHAKTPSYLLKHIEDVITEKEELEAGLDYLAEFGFDVDTAIDEDGIID